jgi:hypothetical protein
LFNLIPVESLGIFASNTPGSISLIFALAIVAGFTKVKLPLAFVTELLSCIEFGLTLA